MTTMESLKTASGAALAVEGEGERASRAMHDVIIWLDIHADGTETRRSGRVWELAPALAGAGRAYWVIPDDRLPGEPGALFVVRAGRRHRIGRPRPHPKDEARTTWVRNGGRYVDKGEHYRETDNRSRTQHVESGALLERGWSLPGIIQRETVEVTNYEAWLRICEARADQAATAAVTKGE